MITSITYWVRLKYLLRKKKRAQMVCEKYRTLLENSDSGISRELLADAVAEENKIQVEMEILHTKYLRRLADEFGIPISNEWEAKLGLDAGYGLGPGWSVSPVFPDTPFFNADYRFNLLKKIRIEQRERRDRLVWWVPLAFGLIGAVTGLVRSF